jgi:uncharacterized repeat protein (TIGR03803 family)
MMKPSIGLAVMLLGSLALLEACSGQRAAEPMLPAESSAASQQPLPDTTGYKLVYSFKGGSDGLRPEADLTYVGGKLYGTTRFGGSVKCLSVIGCGTLFQITLDGTHKVLHAFTGYPNDGVFPLAGVIAVNGKLYGTTFSGGASAIYGTVYESSMSGQEKVLHNFGNGGDGREPTAELIEHNGVLFGTTRSGGNANCDGSGDCGTVFSTTVSGREKVLYAFRGKDAPKDGGVPYAGLTALNGIFYGTNHYNAVDAGAVFQVSASGKERVLYNFTGKRDGAWPTASLTVLNGKLYGTTGLAGAYGWGTVFTISSSGKLHTLYAFKGSPNDGAYPAAHLTVLNGQLYGTTWGGGAHSCFSSGGGCGTVFAVSPSGKEKVLYSFAGGKDGAAPLAGLLNVNGTLYGTTDYGGDGKCAAYSGSPSGCGTIFSLTP